jgi:hypothetical protein
MQVNTQTESITLSPHSKISEAMLCELDILLESVSVRELSRHLRYVFMNYLAHESVHPDNFPEIVSNMHTLFQFLDGIAD